MNISLNAVWSAKSEHALNKFRLAGLLGLMMLSGLPQALAATSTTDEDSLGSYNNRGAWSGTNSYAVNDLVTYGGNTFVDIVATGPVTTVSATTGPNVFDKTAVASNAVITSATGALFSAFGFHSSGFVNVSGSSSFVTNITLSIFDPQYGIAFYDSNRSYISGTTMGASGTFPAGVAIPVPAGVSYVRFWWADQYMGTTLDAAIVNTGTTLQSTYTAFGSPAPSTTNTTPSATPTDTQHWAAYTGSTPAATSSGPWSGKKMFMLGDSIVWVNSAVAGQIATSIGATLSSRGATAPGIDAFPGRTFDAFQNGQGPTGVYLPLSASVIADVDLMVIALGTNQDSSAGIGSTSDTPSLSGSMSAQMRSMLETIMSWKPGMRIVVVGPYQTSRYNLATGTDGLLATWDGTQGIANAASLATLAKINTGMKAVCNLYGIPYIDMYDESGVNFSTSALWLVDGLHPNSLGYNTFYAPYISSQLGRFIQ